MPAADWGVRKEDPKKAGPDDGKATDYQEKESPPGHASIRQTDGVADNTCEGRRNCVEPDSRPHGLLGSGPPHDSKDTVGRVYNGFETTHLMQVSNEVSKGLGNGEITQESDNGQPSHVVNRCGAHGKDAPAKNRYSKKLSDRESLDENGHGPLKHEITNKEETADERELILGNVCVLQNAQDGRVADNVLIDGRQDGRHCHERQDGEVNLPEDTPGFLDRDRQILDLRVQRVDEGGDDVNVVSCWNDDILHVSSAV